MNEFLKYISIIKKIIDADYEKERVFYDAGVWYDRYNCRNISLDELGEIAVNVANKLSRQYYINEQLTDKIYEILGDDEGDKFMNELHGYNE